MAEKKSSTRKTTSTPKKPAAKKPAAKKPAAKKPAAPKPSPEDAAYQKLYQLRKAMGAAREEVDAANRNLARASGLNTIAHRVSAEDQALAQLNDARARYHEAYTTFHKAKAEA
jgi:hypothetical protein